MKLKLSKNLKNMIARIEKIKKMGHGKGKLTVEVDYFKSVHWLEDDNSETFQPFMIVFVHDESYFILGTHLVVPDEKFQMEFFDQFLKVLETSPFTIGKILVKKQELFDLFEKTSTDLNIEIEMVKRLPAVESVKRDIARYFK